MEAAEQQLPGVEDRDQVPADLHALGAPAANMQPAVRRGRGGSRAPLPAQVSQAGYTNPPAQSPDALAVASVLRPACFLSSAWFTVRTQPVS
jgi:hypothetical protein